ncbi:hypothetical protein E2C01_030088 [Portunus trituberculatus]|uniref:Uncharacterized protein n=1 Tax=Portunus trituberculatus TaxID=210409 RepID=A0A5B7EUS7_PORTR|nr:hypothetical protein [Portunus trituberculatus]
MYLLTRDPQLYCDDCLVPLTVRHLIVKCPSLTDLRHRYLYRCRGIEIAVSIISQRSLDQSAWPKAMTFLAGCPVQGKILFTSLLHSRYHNHFHIYTDISRSTNPLSVGAAIYIPTSLPNPQEADEMMELKEDVFKFQVTSWLRSTQDTPWNLGHPVNPPENPPTPTRSPVPILSAGCNRWHSPGPVGGILHQRKPAYFDGKATWEVYQAQFELIAASQDWSDLDRVMKLVASLLGPALEVLAHHTPVECASYDAVVRALQRRFFEVQLVDVYRARLKGQFRQREEALPILAQDIEASAPEEMVTVLAAARVETPETRYVPTSRRLEDLEVAQDVRCYRGAAVKSSIGASEQQETAMADIATGSHCLCEPDFLHCVRAELKAGA